MFSRIYNTKSEKMDYIELLDKYMQGATSPEEEKQLLQWIQNNSFARATILAHYEKHWAKHSRDEVPAELQHEMLMNIKRKMHAQPASGIKNIQIGNKGKKNLWLEVMKYAAVILVTISVAVSSTYFYLSPAESEGESFIVYADKGQRSNVVLPDGTKVWLNSDSRLEYDTHYGQKERKVKLTGEAYFQVAKDADHRFLVHTDIMDVEALGTTFNVQAYPDDAEIVTTLVEGKVRVSAGDNEVVLLPKQLASYGRSGGLMKVSKMENTDYATGWMKGEFAFSGASLQEIAKELSRMYNMKIQFKSEEIKKYHFSGVIQNNSLTNVLEIIGLTSPVVYEVRNDSIILDKQE